MVLYYILSIDTFGHLTLHLKSLVTKRDKRQSEKIELLPRKHRQ